MKPIVCSITVGYLNSLMIAIYLGSTPSKFLFLLKLICLTSQMMSVDPAGSDLNDIHETYSVGLSDESLSNQINDSSEPQNWHNDEKLGDKVDNLKDQINVQQVGSLQSEIDDEGKEPNGQDATSQVAGIQHESQITTISDSILVSPDKSLAALDLQAELKEKNVRPCSCYVLFIINIVGLFPLAKSDFPYLLTIPTIPSFLPPPPPPRPPSSF